MFYSKSTRGFYVSGAPADAVIISREVYLNLLAEQTKGFEIVPDSNGYPVLHAPAMQPPPSVTMYQARAVLIDDDLIDDVEMALAGMPDGKEKRKALAAWEYAATVDRNSEFTQMLAAALQLTPSQLDDLFIRAGKVT